MNNTQRVKCSCFAIKKSGNFSTSTQIIESVDVPVPGGGGGGTLIFSHIRRLGLFFWVQNSELQYFWGFQKNEYFLGV